MSEESESSESSSSDFVPQKKSARTKNIKKVLKRKVAAKKQAASYKTKLSSKPKSKGKTPYNEEESKLAIANFVKKENRPLNGINVYDGLKGSVPKSKVTALLDKLVEENAVSMKLFKKTKIFFAPQDEFAEVTDDQLSRMEKLSIEKSKEVTDLVKKNAILNKELITLNSEPSDSDLVIKIDNVKNEIVLLNEKIASLTQKQSNSNSVVSEQSLAEQTNLVKSRVAEWKKRKAIADRMAEAFMGEDSSKKPAQFLSELGCETDRDVGVDLADFIKFL